MIRQEIAFIEAINKKKKLVLTLVFRAENLRAYLFETI